MVPSAFVWLDTLPLNPNGKIDIPALPKPQEVPASPQDMAPRTPTEAALAAIFGDVLELESVHIDSHFFELGGHSLLATRLIAQLIKTFDLDLNVIDLFEAPTVAELAARIEQKRLLEDLSSMNLEGDREEIAL
jgi:acyl carrier protein